MSQNVTWNGQVYPIPNQGDAAPWGSALTTLLVAIPAGALQKSGGTFTLTAETDFGASFGLKSLYFKSRATNPAAAGIVRLGSTEVIAWRNAANGADLPLTTDGSDNLTYNTTKVLLSGAVVNADINASAAIAYSKLALTGSIVNADISSSAAIAYSKLALSGSIVNADIGASAAIALSKLAALATGFALRSNASTGAIEVSAVTATEQGYLSGVTSAIQTQLNAKAPTASPTFTGTAVAATLDAQTLLKGKGTATNDNAAAGYIGEAFNSSRSVVGNTGATGVWTDILTLLLSAGDWDVTGIVELQRNTATWTGGSLGISTTSGNSATGLNSGDNEADEAFVSSATTPTAIMLVVPSYRLSLSVPATVYCKVLANFSAGQPQYLGRISARRVR